MFDRLEKVLIVVVGSAIGVGLWCCATALVVVTWKLITHV